MQFKIYIFFSTHKVCSWDHNVTDRRSLPGENEMEITFVLVTRISYLYMEGHYLTKSSTKNQFKDIIITKKIWLPW